MDDFRTPGDGSFSLGSRTWPGLSKLVEECGEVLQIAGKIMGTGGTVQHWDGKGDLDERFRKDYDPTPEALALVRQRIQEKIALKPHWYRHNGKPII